MKDNEMLSDIWDGISYKKLREKKLENSSLPHPNVLKWWGSCFKVFHAWDFSFLHNNSSYPWHGTAVI